MFVFLIFTYLCSCSKVSLGNGPLVCSDSVAFYQASLLRRAPVSKSDFKVNLKFPIRFHSDGKKKSFLID